MDLLKQSIDQVKGDLLELENLLKEDKDRNHPKVKDVENKICTSLDIPRESWMNSDQSLKDVIDSLQEKLNILQNATIPQEMIPDKDVLKTASGGLALEGVYKTRNLEDLLVNREHLIEIPESFSLTYSKQKNIYEKREFSSHKSRKTFDRVMEKMGQSFRNSLHSGFKCFLFGLGDEENESSEREEESSNSEEESYILQTKYNYIPLACGVFQREELRLSNAALQALKKLELMIVFEDHKSLINKVRHFFERFGSHVNQGPLYFGGIFWWRASASGFKGNDLLEVKNLTLEALNVCCGGGGGKVGARSSQLGGSLTGKYREDLMSQVHLSVSKTGGPPEIDDHFLWKSHLTSNNKTWSVIDRGTALIPVWEIVMTSHRHNFTDVSKFRSMLMNAYKEITGQHVEEVWGHHILSQVDKAEALIQSVKTWSATDCESHLTHLFDFKTRLFEETESNTMWLQKCLSNKILQNYLFEVTTIYSESPAVNMRCLMRALLEPGLYTIENFENRREIVNWANETELDPNEYFSVSDFSELDSILQRLKKEMQDKRNAFSSSEQHHTAKMKATKTATIALNCLCRTLGENDQEEAKLLIKSIITAFGYSSENKTFNHLLDVNEITLLQSELHDAFSRYSSLREQCPIRAQAYLLLTALTISTDKERTVSSEEKAERLILKDKLSNPIKSVVEKIQDDWESLEKALDSIILGRQEDPGSWERTEEELECQMEDRVMKVTPLPELHGTDEHNSPVCEKHEIGESFMDLLQKLGLQEYYPKKMTKTSVLAITRLSLSVDDPKTEKDLYSHYLYKLMMLDYKVRQVCVKLDNTTMDYEQAGESAEDDDDDFGEDADLSSPDDEKDFLNGKQTQIHPMDVFMAIFHCSNDFLRQYIFTKLSACQFSLPFLVPNPCTDEVEFPLWALRHIKKSWHSKAQTASGSSGNYHNRQMFNSAVPVVSFIRVGNSRSNSKSQILNGVINGQKHSVFFNRHCKNSTPHSLLMNGIVEIAWYCPGGKKDDRFDDCVAFLNLHGDAAEHHKQLEFLQAVSTVIVLLLSEQPSESAKETYKQLYQSPVPLISLFSDKNTVQRSKKRTKVKLAAKNRNQAEFTEELISSIKQCISENKQTASIESCCEKARKQQFMVDEDKQSCKDGHEEAQKLVNLLKDVKILNLKETILPLQGKLWHDWCKKNKEKFRLQNKEKISIEKQLSEISDQMNNIRRKQLDEADSLSDFMRSFLNCLTVAVLSSSAQFEDMHLYVLQWLRILLDELISDELNCITVTFGLEHVMREVGQLYEAIQHCLQKSHRMTNSNKQLYVTLPQIGARMLISGYPLELMDGDAAHVPLVWIEAVLNQLIKSLGDKKVFVLSILGLQSSGKSTLLNTMFGLQFDVSAGRCTRGAFMQLLEVDTSIREELGYDFVLIVDTEGLRSLELSTKISVNHDNELATFIIGVGDVTVINIMGENPSEMQDILQICVQAFLRMKRVKITPSCIFVHQNVADESARDKNAEGRRRLVEKLDEMAEVAAKEEDDNTITCFSDVIQFDVDTQAFYFKNLLEGDPPMAPPNPSYSQNVQELKTKLLTVGQWKDRCQFSSLSEFRSRASDLWMALLQENFVFSFKNTVELMHYNSLENEYERWSWELRKHSLDLQTTLQKKIGSNLKVVLADIKKDFGKIYIPIKNDIDFFFANDKNKEILINWKESINLRFSNLNSELIEATLRKCKKLLAAKQMRSELDQKRAKYINQLTEQSKSLASKLKTKTLTEKKIIEEFDGLWANWTTEVSKSLPPEELLDVKAEVETVLLKKFKNEQNILERLQRIQRENTDEQQNVLKSFESFMHDSDMKSAKMIIEKATDTVNKHITANKDNKKKAVDGNFICEILSCIDKDITEFEEVPGNPKLAPEFRVDLSVYLCFKNVSELQKMHDHKKRFHGITSNIKKVFAIKEDEYAKCLVEDFLRTHFRSFPNIKHKVQRGMILTAEKSPTVTSWLQILCNSAQFLMKQATHTVNKCIAASENDMKDFDENLIYEILSCIEKDVTEIETLPGHSKISNEFKVDLSVHICLKNIPRFQKMHEEFKKSNHPLTYLHSQRETYFQSFTLYCKGVSSVTIFVDFLCKNIKPEILNAAHSKTCQQIADKLKNNNPALNGTRSKLENHILRDLATLEDFSHYEEYVNCPKKYFEKFIKEKVKTFCQNTRQLSTLYLGNLNSLTDEILEASTKVSTEVDEQKGDASLWLDLFCENVGSLIEIEKADLQNIKNEEISDWTFFNATMASSLEEMIKDEKIDPSTLIGKPTSLLFEQLQGCWATCPLCGATCTNTIPNHDEDHSVRFHRCKALRGWHTIETGHFSITFCTTSVASNGKFRCSQMGDVLIPYKKYRTAGPPYDKWSITADGSTQCYWKWFLCRFRSLWEKKYGYRFTGRGEIPSEWENITKDDVLKELEQC